MRRKSRIKGLAGLLEHGDLRRVRGRGGGDEWHYSVVDLVALLAGTDHPEEYWSDLKRGEPALGRLTDYLEYECPGGGVELIETVSLDGLLRVAQSVQSPRAERVRQWLATSGARRLAEANDPELALLRVRRDYARRGRGRAWIDKRLRGISARHELTSEWARRGVTDSGEYRALTNRLMEAAFGMDVEAYRRSKHLGGAGANLRDHMTDLELLVTTLGESAAVVLHRGHGSRGFDELVGDVAEAGALAAHARAVLQGAVTNRSHAA